MGETLGDVTSILVADDELAMRNTIRRVLEDAGYRVLTARDGESALALLHDQQVDLIVADIAMPGMNGYQLYERVRENPAWVTLPFIFLTARALDSDVRYGKAMGVDDYLTKPIEPKDLLAAVRGKLRRARQVAEQIAQLHSPASRAASASCSASESFVVGPLRIDTVRHAVWMDEEPVQLSAREFTLLVYLARQAGRVIPPPELIQVTHELDTDDAEAGALLRPMIYSLRRKLGASVGDEGCIENVRGVGYRLILPEQF